MGTTTPRSWSYDRARSQAQVRRALDPPVEAVIALRSRWAKRLSCVDRTEIRQLGRWLGVFAIDEDMDGDPYFAATNFYFFATDVEAVDAFDELLEEALSS